MYKPTHKQRSNKCFVLVLAALVILCAILLAFASVVLRARTPLLQFQSASVNHITYNTSPSPFFNLTMIAHLSFNNPNFGSFDYENRNVSLLYGNSTVGHRELGNGRVKARQTKGMNVTLNLRSDELLLTGNLTNDILSGILNLTSYTELTGIIHLLKIFNKKRTTQMACTIHLNLTSHLIHNFQC